MIPVTEIYGRKASDGKINWITAIAMTAFHIGAFAERVIGDGWQANDVIQYMTTQSLVMNGLEAQLAVADLILNGVFDRHPGLRVASIENGSDWVHRLAKRMTKLANQSPRSFPDDPVETLREHVWVAPYYEDDLPRLAEQIGADRILFGSDWPHGEGLAEPLSFTEELTEFGAADTRKIMRDNALAFLGAPITASV